MIWLWQVFRWSILSTPHGHCVPSLVLSLGWWNSDCWSLRPQSAPCLLLRSPTKNSHNKLSARLSTPPLDWVTALEPPPSLIANLRTVAKVCNFLVAGVWVNCHWAMLVLCSVMLGCFLLVSAPPMAAAERSAAGDAGRWSEPGMS